MALGVDDTTLKPARRGGPRPETGPEGNQRLTSSTAVALIVLLAVEGVTLLALRQLLHVHFFVGALLIPPVALKLGSTGYRFMRYYTRSPVYVANGAPQIIMRAIAPMVVISTIALFATGIWLALAGPSSRDKVLPLHKASFVVWLLFTGVHVLGHVLELPRAVRSDLDRHTDVAGRSLRWLLLVVAIGGGVALGVWILSYAGAWGHGFVGGE